MCKQPFEGKYELIFSGGSLKGQSQRLATLAVTVAEDVYLNRHSQQKEALLERRYVCFRNIFAILSNVL